MLLQPKRLAQQPFSAISFNGISVFFRDTDTGTRVWESTGSGEQQQVFVPCALFVIARFEFLRCAQSMTAAACESLRGIRFR